MKYGFKLQLKMEHLQAAHWRSASSSHKVLCQQLEASGKESELGDSSKSMANDNSMWLALVVILDSCSNMFVCKIRFL